MIGPAAPKDPEKMREFFYIIRNKEIYGTKTEGGGGIQFLYQDSERLVNSARITGGIIDEEELELLRSVEGFKKLVHSIGVSLETSDPGETGEFIFQMYGKKDMYGGGTNLRADVKGDGREERIYLKDAKWREDDGIPGQIKVMLEKAGEKAELSVRLYLNEGFHAPQAKEEEEVDFTSPQYRQMIENSLISMGDPARLQAAIQKAKEGQDVTLAYIGGSITQGAGAVPIHTECYAYQSYLRFCRLFGKGDNVHFIKAGVGGTPSELGIIRFDRDVLRDGSVSPDILVIEFAVNDEGDETKGDCYESLVRKALGLPGKPAVLLLFSVFANDENLQERMIPIGRHYNLPMVSIKNGVTPQFYDKEKKVLSKNQFFYDMFHPSNIGHRIMADCVEYAFSMANRAGRKETGESKKDLLENPPLIGNTFEHVKLMDKKNPCPGAVVMPGGFTYTDKVLQSVEMDGELEQIPQFPYNWQYRGNLGGEPDFCMDISCRALLLVFKDSGETDVAKAHIYVDGKFVRTADPYVNGWLHCNAMIILKEDVSRMHHVEISVEEEDRKKQCTILGFGYVE